MQRQRVTDYSQQVSAPPSSAEVLEQLSQGVWVADNKGRIRYTNPALDRMFGYERGELHGQHLVRLLAQGETGEIAKFREISETLQMRGGWRGDCLNQRKDGSVFTCFLRIHTRELQHESQWIGVQEEGSVSHFLNQFSSNYVALALRELQSSFNEVFGWSRLIRAGQMNAQQAAEALESIEQRARAQQQLLANLLELAQLSAEPCTSEPMLSAVAPPPEANLASAPANITSYRPRAMRAAARLNASAL